MSEDDLPPVEGLTDLDVLPPLDNLTDLPAVTGGVGSDAAGPRPSLAPLSDVPVTVEAVLGHSNLTVEELLHLRTGSVIEVDRRVGDPIDLVVGGRLLARGELVLIDGALGLTLTEIVERDAS